MTGGPRTPPGVEALVDERDGLRRQLETALDQMAGLQSRIAELRSQCELLTQRYVEQARRNSDLTNLYVAAHRLHQSHDRGDVLAAIQEIVINLIGSEELAVFELTEDGSSLRLLDSFGIDQGRWTRVPLGTGPLAEAVRAGRPYVAGSNGEPGGPPEMLACIPLMFGARAMGLVAVFSLLPQKKGLEAVDRELFDVLRAHGGVALHCTRAAKEGAAEP